IFMIVIPKMQKTTPVDLTKAQNPRDMADADKDDAVVIAVTRDGSLFIGSTKVQPDEITPKVKDMISNRVDKTVYLKSEANGKFGDVVKVVDNVRAAVVASLGLLAERLVKKGPTGAPTD